MSDLAERRRHARRAWAANGSSHDRVIAVARVALPLGIATLAVFLALAPLTIGRDLSFILSKDRVEVASERMRVTHAAYRGADGKGQPFRLDAASAVQATSRDPIVRLRQLDGRIQLADGPATVQAPAGRYDLDTQHVAFDGPVHFEAAGGYRIDTANVLLDMNTRRLESRGAVTGTIPLGTFAADRMQADLDGHIVVLTGRARLHVQQGRSRAAR